MIASDRTGDGERRRGPVDGGSSASKEPEIKGRSILAVARRAAAEIVPTPAARRSSGGGVRPVVGGGLVTASRATVLGRRRPIGSTEGRRDGR